MAHSGSKFMLGLLGLLLLFLTGCPVDSSVTLSPISEAEIDKALLGNWASFEEGKPEGEFRAFPFNDHELLIITCDYGKSQESQANPIRAFTSVIEGEKFLNIQWIDEETASSRTWTFINYQVQRDELRWRFLTDVLFPKDKITSQELAQIIKNNLENKDLYDSYKVFKRVQK